MRLREQSQIGWLMAQLVGAKSLPDVTREAQRVSRARAGTESASSFGLPQTRSPGPAPSTFSTVDSGRYASTLAEALPGESLAARAKRLIEKNTALFRRSGKGPVVFDEVGEFPPELLHEAQKRLLGEQLPSEFNVTPGEVLTWPSVEAMLRGEPPDGYEAALMRAAVESGGAITRVDPERGTVTVEALVDKACAKPNPSIPRCSRCRALLGGMYGSVCMNCEV